MSTSGPGEGPGEGGSSVNCPHPTEDLVDIEQEIVDAFERIRVGARVRHHNFWETTPLRPLRLMVVVALRSGNTVWAREVLEGGELGPVHTYPISELEKVPTQVTS